MTRASTTLGGGKRKGMWYKGSWDGHNLKEGSIQGEGHSHQMMSLGKRVLWGHIEFEVKHLGR
jgi:hypothetical protein